MVIPNLLSWPNSVVVLDIKRENYAATAGFRVEAGQRVLLFDPLARDGRTTRFNPLAHIDRTDALAVLDELQRMALMLFPTPPQSDPFWSEAARTGFIGVGAWVAATAERPFTLGEIFRQLTQGDPRVRFPKLIKARRQEGRPLPAGCVSALSDFCASSDNTFASIRQSITSRMGLWLNPLADAATAASDFDLRDLQRGDLSLYLGASPADMVRVAPLYSLLFQQLVDLSSRSLPGPEGRPVLVLLDEFAWLGPGSSASPRLLLGRRIRSASVAGDPEPVAVARPLRAGRHRGDPDQLRAGGGVRPQGAAGGPGTERPARLLHLRRAQPEPTTRPGRRSPDLDRLRSTPRSNAAPGADAAFGP